MAKKKAPPSNVVPIGGGPDPAIAGVLDARDLLGLRLNDKRKPIGCLENVVTLLLTQKEWQGVLAFNELSLAIEKRQAPPFECGVLGEWTDKDDNEARLWFSEKFDVRVPVADVAAGASIVAGRNTYHPIREYLDGLTWDGTARLATWLQRYLGAEAPRDDARTPEYYQKAGAWWLTSAVARIYAPGAKADHVLLLEGEQGIGKSSALSILFGDWFSDTPLRIGDKDSYGALRGVWCIELAELDSLNRAESSASKALFSSRVDKYRPPYGHRDIQAPRQCVFAGTVNHDEYLRDSTGNRRYWPVRCTELRLRGPDSLEEVRDQLFAEAVAAYRAGAPWYPQTSDDKELFREQQAARELGDVYEDMIRTYVANKSEISMREIFEDCLNTEPAKMTRAEQSRVGEVMKKLGWRKRRESTGRRSYIYVRPRDATAAEPGEEFEGGIDVPF
ncbi:MAG: virulence-associated E family protein [Burkholderiales bacterium]